MTYTLYIDVLFFVNFLMDILLLMVLRKIIKYQTPVWRLIPGASVGAAAACFAAWQPGLPLWVGIPAVYLAVPALMVWASFGLCRPKDVIRGVLGLYLTAVMVGGVITVLYQHTVAGYYIEQVARGNVRGIPLLALAFFAAGSYFLVRYLWTFVLDTKKRRDCLCLVTLHYRGREKTVTALMDTGNRLYEPVSKQPVHVVTYEALRNLCGTVSSVIFIPFSSVGKVDGMLPGIFLDEMEIRQGDAVRKVVKPLVAVCRHPLSPDGEYEMLLHEE